MPAPGSSAGQFGAGASGATGGRGVEGTNGASGANSTAASSQAESMPTVRHTTGQTPANYTADAVKSIDQTQTGNAVRGAPPAAESPPSTSVAKSGIGDDSAAVKAKYDSKA